MAPFFVAVLTSLFLSTSLLAGSLQCDKVHPDAHAAKRVSRTGKPLKPVFIYINNDFAVNPGFDSAYQEMLKLFAKIRSAQTSSLPDTDKKYLATAADVLQGDLNSQINQSDRQMRELDQFGCGENSKFGNGLVVISNHATRTPVKDNSGVKMVDLQLTYCRPDTKNLSYERGTSPIEFAYSDHSFKTKPQLDLFVSQLLLMPHMLEYAIERVLKLFPSDEYHYFVWVRGFGNANYVTLPFINADYSSVPADQIWGAILTTKADLANGPTASLALRKSLEESFAPLVYDNRYVGKIQLLEILQKFSSVNKNMMFPYVVLNTDESSLANNAPEWIETLLKEPKGLEGMQIDAIGQLCSHPKSSEVLRNFSFRDLFLPLGVPSGTPFVEHFSKTLKKAAK